LLRTYEGQEIEANLIPDEWNPLDSMSPDRPVGALLKGELRDIERFNDGRYLRIGVGKGSFQFGEGAVVLIDIDAARMP
jgi:hypothetical protein